ncbi:MAG: response regulator [Fibromonadaceae bacterium]|jgi:signal transduction histidine kinase/DNA-binding response OmpR family regulator|nr:response regulator [Fibromonadaceae bacterium]
MPLRIRTLLSLFKENHLYLFSVIAVFFVIIVFNYIVTKNSFETRLEVEVNIISVLSANLLKSNLQNFETNFFEDAHRIEKFINDTDDFSSVQELIKSYSYKKMLVSDELDTMHIYGVLRGKPFANHTSDFEMPLSIIENFPWYKNAMAANGGLVQNSPYENPAICSKGSLISWSKELFDKNREPIGAINLAIHFSEYAELFTEVTKFDGGYIILTDSNDIVLSHIEKSYIGQSIANISKGWSELRLGETGSVKGLRNYQEKKSYIFKKKLFNNWNIYIVIPLDGYYRDLYLALLQSAAISIICLIFLSFLLIRLNTASKKSIMESEAKSNFLAIMSHEIRTPLNAIIGFSQLEMENRNLPETSKNTVEKILVSSQNLLNIIDGILDLSKIEKGKYEIEPHEYDVPSLVNDVCVIGQACIGSKPLELKISISPDIPSRFMGDMQSIKQILNNFLNNAVKYTEEGFIEFSAVYTVVNDKPSMKFKVKDSGVGIKQEDIPKLFGMYSRLDAKSRSISGTGLGLSITKKLADMMGGTIEVNSIYGKGSEFSICIPQEIVDSTPIGEEIAENLQKLKYSVNKVVVNKSFMRTQLSGASILVVDDVQMNLDVMRGILEPYGLHIETATSGQQAINLLKNGNKYDVIFMDHMMPVMDGIETTKIIRELSGDYFKHVPIVAFTANAMSGNDKIFLQKGFNDFISKPVDIRKLDACLNRWIKKREKIDFEPVQSSTGFQVARHYIDFAEGIEQFGSEATFKKMLASFKKHTPDLLKNMQGQTGEDYIISVHALKGCVRTIFAKELGDRAYELEVAAKEGNWEFVNSRSDVLIKDVQKLVDAISVD